MNTKYKFEQKVKRKFARLWIEQATNVDTLISFIKDMPYEMCSFQFVFYGYCDYCTADSTNC